MYRLEEEKLYRYSYLLLDQTAQLKPEKQLLLSGVKEWQIRVMPPNAQLSDQMEWKREWPIGGKLNSDDADKPPRAIKITFDIEGLGEVHRVLP
jgi:general secretion pathway protein J